MKHKIYIEEALKQAKKAYKKNEVPVGCVIVDNATGKMISKAFNKVEKDKNACCHAEIIAIQKACKKMQTKYLIDCSLYVTLEPCTMCAGAISLAKISNLYFLTQDKKGGAVVNGVKFFDKSTCHHKPKVKQYVFYKEAGKLLKDFFKEKR